MRTVFEDVRLIDAVSADARDNVDVVVDDDRILAVSPLAEHSQQARTALRPPSSTATDGRCSPG